MSLCLNMIVKNESHLIEKTLNNLCSYIKFTYWVICDTGSSDNTVSIIKNFFLKKNIQGEIFHHTWKDFGYNRTLALSAAFNKTDYLLIFDADDSISGNLTIPNLSEDRYGLFFGTESLKYVRPILINNRKKWKFKGILHEYLEPLESVTQLIPINGDYFIISGKDGNRSKNSDKYLNDALLLKKKIDLIESGDIEDIDLLPRYTFYCANSFRDCNDISGAIFYYKKVLEHETWVQEKYISAFNIGNLYEMLKNIEDALLYWYRAITYDKERREAVVKLMSYYYNNKNWFAINCLHENIKNFEIIDISSKLFLHISDIHQNHYFNSIACANISEWMSGYYSCKHLLMRDVHTDITLYNFKCYAYNIHLDPDNKPFLDKLLILFKKYYFSRKELIEHLWNITSKNFKNVYNLDNLCQITDTNTTDIINNNSILKSKHKILLHETSNKILIYTGYMNYLWNDSTLKTSALGGSEKAVIYLSRYFPKNYKIYIAGDTLEEEIDNIKYVNHANLQSLLDTEKFHTIIVSRYISFLEKYSNYKCFQLVLCAHDTIFLNYQNSSNDTDNTLKTFIGIVDCVVCLTEWHQNILLQHHSSIKDANFKIINNGINLSDFENEELNNTAKIKNKFVWSSCSERGLDILLKLWPSILEKIPDATLDICSYNHFPSNDRDLDIKKTIDNYDSIIHHGKLQTDQLYKLLKKSEYWLYTNTFPETSCITSMEMLRSCVICIYYPNAGLVDTIGDYGIKVNTGTEIETILKLSEEDKAMFHKKGKEYSLNCSWELRAQEWSRILNLNNTKKIAIFNSFCFHYEMFGYIIEYCKINNFVLTIYTSFDNTLGWLEFYKNIFQNYQFEIKSVLNFENEREIFDIVFITTDDDYFFKEECITSKCVAVQHTYNIRRKEFLNNLCTRRFLNFSENENENENENKHYAIPSFTIFKKNEKENKIHECVNVCLLGGRELYNYDIVNRLTSDLFINLYVISRYVKFSNESVTNGNINIIKMSSIDTQILLNILKKCDYILTDVTENEDHANGQSMSGCIPLSFSTLTPLIISKKNNKLYNFKNVIEFNTDTGDKIIIEKNSISIDLLESERNEIKDRFHKYTNRILLVNKNTALIIEPRDNKNLPNLIKDFKLKLGSNWKVVFYCGKGLKDKLTQAIDSDVEIRELDVNNFTSSEYSDFMKARQLWESLYGNFVLTFQIDAYILNEPPYTIDFFTKMNKSYIGGNMEYIWGEMLREDINPEYRNFNGGLSLRKREHMLNIINTFEPEKTIPYHTKFHSCAEDVYFTIGCYKLNYLVGDTQECQHFGLHTIFKDKYFGIHKPNKNLIHTIPGLSQMYCEETNTFIID